VNRTGFPEAVQIAACPQTELAKFVEVIPPLTSFGFCTAVIIPNVRPDMPLKKFNLQIAFDAKAEAAIIH
jgi:hypothetical protein